jgi:hypothetical protein
MPDFYASGWFSPGGHRDNDAGGCNHTTQISRRRKGRKGRRRHHCVNINGNHLREDKGGAGGNPCAHFSSITKIGGAHQGGGDYSGKSDVFGGASAGLRCGLNNDRITDASIRSWSNSAHMTRVNATGKRGDGGGQKKDRTLYEQSLFGFSSSVGTQRTGYCSNTANLMKAVSHKNETCYDKIKSAMNAGEAEREAREWCKTNRTSPKCKCVNVQDGGTNFINHCKTNPTWSGCPEINSAFKTFEDAGLTSASGLFGNSDCLVPGLCDGSGVIMPSSGKPNACANKLAICDQKVASDNIQAQNLLIEQGCEINFEADTNAADGQTVPPPPPPPPPPSSDPSSAPLKSSSSNDDDDEDEDEKELKIYEKPVFQIGTVASSSCSIFSCLILIMLTM